MRTAHAYQIDGEPADHRQFTAAACNPARSVVVEACAGSGKTWLLVARMLRLLLAGAEPSELLAVTFTRKAAQEMRERLDQLLHELALADDTRVRALLTERGVPEREVDNLLPAARTLYRRVLASPQSLSIDTFHSWFGRLVQVAPLTAGVPHGYTLSERSGELVDEAWRLFMQSLNGIDRAEVRNALTFLYESIGDAGAESMLKNFLSKRAEWWASTQDDADGEEPAPLTWLRELCGEDGERDARLGLWEDGYLLTQLRQMASLLGKGTKKNQDRAIAIESALSAAPGLESFEALRREFFTQAGEPAKNLKTKDLLKALAAHYGEDGASAFDTEFDSIGMMLDQLERRSWDMKVVELNRALFTAGAALLEHYREVKAAQRVFDFTDLEWHAYRLLSDEGHAAYLQSRLDARYKHILLDEFQDTNPLQWNVVRAWLEAYGMDAAQPSVFIVGDPKQSIYRFRRAEPRVFDGARELLKIRGASVLRTNQTRRNASAIVDVLNQSQRDNPIFAPQTTMESAAGAVWRLPLVVRRAAEDDDAAAAPTSLRNPLTTASEEEEDARRLDEGSAVAVALRHALDALRKTGPACWRDVMLLVRQRKHLPAYERALRDAGIPFVSDKRGGLLDAVEVRDLIALLTFLITPGDDRALAHVLKSPIAGAGDADLIALATGSAGSWWDRLNHAVREDRNEGGAPHLAQATAMLQAWMADAAHLPVHDLLDRILHRGCLMERYAQTSPAAMRAQTLANIEAFTELALNLDAGRYPSLPKFIAALRSLQEGADNEAPDEAGVAVAEDAVRILTIHSAKGLEAPIVFLLDSNHSKPKRDDSGVLCDWPQQETRPIHFSAFGKRAERGLARTELFAAEERYKEQEDWNLLYVAVTRARHMLVISGVQETRGALPDGVVEGSWYHRLQAAPVVDLDAMPASVPAAPGETFALNGFDASPLPADAGAVADRPEENISSAAIVEGLALHALLERVTHAHRWPVALPEPAAIARWLPASRALAATVRRQAEAILSQPALERFFNPSLYHKAHNEMDVVNGDEILRFDRVVIFDDAVWILDYKRNLLDSERAGYRAQLARYRLAAENVFSGKSLKTALITADGRLWEFD